MILTCNCGIKLKVNDEKITEGGVKIRCPKCGTTHTVRKPAASAPVAPAMPWFAPSSQASSGQLVIIAHDSRAVADMISGVLAEAGMTTDYAPNGLEALKKATDLRPCAMVVDVGLTGIYGFELCERLKSDPDTRDIKIILLSSVYGLTAYKRAPVTLYGADDYIEKHHLGDQLVTKLSRLLSGPVPESALPEASTAAAAADAPEVPVSQPVFEPINLSALQAQPVFGRERKQEAPEPAPVAGDEPSLPDIPSILPITPVTLGTTRRSSGPVSHQPPASPPASKEISAAEPRMAVPAPAVAKPAPGIFGLDDASVKLDEGFFEQEEYTAPAATKPAATVDPEEVEKARRFARIIVSDIALYNQEAVDQGIGNGTFYEALRDDIAEGRQVYEARVPRGIRETKDYLQEAFDDFIASQKKLR